jgi:SHS2 domain-containing protein
MRCVSRSSHLKDFAEEAVESPNYTGKNAFTSECLCHSEALMTKTARPRYRLLPHMSDAYVEVHATTVVAVFEESAFAMFDVMTDPTAIKPEFTDCFEVVAHDRIALLHDWLEQLLLKFDLDGKVYSKFKVERIEEQNDDLRLVAKAQGGTFERGRHPAKVEIKAVTFHRMEVKATGNGYIARYILDL